METMTQSDSARSPYVAPRLKVFGTIRDVTRTATTEQHNRNDAVQGGNNLKT
jgi:hypothetical protein